LAGKRRPSNRKERKALPQTSLRKSLASLAALVSVLCGYSNTVEGVFSLIRRGVMGTFHSVSRKHLPNYLNEFQFRWNTRKMDDGQRVVQAVKKIDGKRLLYRESVENPPYLPKPSGQMIAPFEGD
jgi:hypothetical protein